MRARDRSVQVGRNGRCPPLSFPLHAAEATSSWEAQAARRRGAESSDGTAGGRDNKLIAMLALGGVALLAVIGIGAALAFGGGDDGPDATRGSRGGRLHAHCHARGVNVGDHSVTTPDGTSKAEWNTDAADERAALPGSLRSAGPTTTPSTRPARPQSRARRHRIHYGTGSRKRPCSAAGLRPGDITRRRFSRPIPPWEIGSPSGRGSLRARRSRERSGTAYLAKCPDFDETAFAAFFDAYQFQGPERSRPTRSYPAATRLRSAGTSRGGGTGQTQSA